MKKILFLLTAMIAVVSNVQSAVYTSEIQSFGNYCMDGKTFYVISGNPNVSNKDLEFLEYKDFVTQCMLLKNGILCENSDSADVCILLDYGIVDKSYVASRSVPVWGITGTSLVTTTCRYISAAGTSLTSTAVSSVGISATLNYPVEVPRYRRVLNLYAYDNKEKQEEPIMIWKTNILSEGISRNLLEVMPYMVYTGIHYMGKQTNSIKRGTISEYDMDVFFIRNKYHLRDDVHFVQPAVSNVTDLPIAVHSVVCDEKSTTVNLIARYVPDKLTYPKFREQTYIVYKGVKYPIHAVYLPLTESKYKNRNYLNKGFVLEHDYNLIQLLFPIQLQKGDTFDIISYANKKESKLFVQFNNIVVQ